MLRELHMHLPMRTTCSLLIKAEPAITQCSSKSGAGDGDRTRDFLLGKEMLYH